MDRNNNQWEEQLRSRLWRAKQWKERLEHEIKLQQLALEKWTKYIQALERTLELEGELDLESGLINGSAKAKSVTESLVVFALQKLEYTFTVKDAIDRLIEQRLYPDEKGAGDSVYGIVAHREDLFRRKDRATYQLTEKAIALGKSLTQPSLPEVLRVTSRESPPSHGRNPLGRFLLEALQERGKSLQELKREAQGKGLTFPGKHPGRVLHYALVGMSQNRLVEKVNGMWRLKKFMGDGDMKCPACPKYADTDPMNVARHMMTVFDEPHIKWIEAHGLNPTKLLGVVGKGDYKVLADLLEKTVKRNR